MTQINIATDETLKRDIVERAFGRLGMAGYEFGRSAEEVTEALGLLDDMMADWPYSAITSYEQPAYGSGSADQGAGIAPADRQAVIAGLALRLAPLMGRDLTPPAMAILAKAEAGLRARYAAIPSMPFASDTPAGMGNRARFVRTADLTNRSDDPGDLTQFLDG